MKVVILAGGLGTRLAEETNIKPKPMVEIGGRPILWHIFKHYGHHGMSDFYVALGYKGDVIKRFFLDYYPLSSDLTIDLGTGSVDISEKRAEAWRVHLIETGRETNTGGRLLRLREHLEDGTFMMTYGDGVANVDLDALLRFHREHGLIATITAVRPPARFGGLEFARHRVSKFTEKPQIGEGWINGGFAVFEPAIFDYLDGPGTSLEAETLERLADEGQLAAYRHEQFWQCMDNKRDLELLESLWQRGEASWKTWDD